MTDNLWEILNDQDECQKVANTAENDWLDCLDPLSWKCFKEACVIARVSAWNTVLITGANGTGKSGYAKLIWNENVCESAPPKREILEVNCAAFSDNLIASELFGHVKGSFTGAIKDSSGKIRTAFKERKCLFLDEIGDLPLSAQASLLRFFQNGEIQTVGSPKPEKLTKKLLGYNVDDEQKEKDDKDIELKVVCATNKDLEEEVRKGNFREDLYNRINKFRVVVPSLKDRPEDCEQNYVNFFEKFKRKNKGAPWLGKLDIDRQKFGKENKKHKYQWPGNFRELQNRLQQAIVQKLLNGGGVIDYKDLFPEGIETAKSNAAGQTQNAVLENVGFPALSDKCDLQPFDLEEKLSELANAYIDRALDQTKTKQEAAKLLGYSSYQKMDRRKSRQI